MALPVLRQAICDRAIAGKTDVRACSHRVRALVVPTRRTDGRYQAHVAFSGSKRQTRTNASSIKHEEGAGPLAGAYSTLGAVWAFSRPHTMIGTALSVVSISLLALGGSQAGAAAMVALLQALVSALLMNIAIVGINQLYDIDIDKVNKPYLPLASGALTPGQGLAIVVASALGSTAVGLASGSAPLLATLLVSMALGVLYSADLPFMRWKRSPLLAAGCILAVRAIIVQLGFYTHMLQALGAASGAAPGAATTSAALAGKAAAAGSVWQGVLAALTPSVMFVIGFMLFFSIVIALFKDIPDVMGDRQAGVRTLSVRLGEGSVFRICVGLLAAAYVWAMGASLVLPEVALAKGVLFVGHAVLCGLLLNRARGVDTREKSHLVDYYMFVWKLFYAEYLLIPLFG